MSSRNENEGGAVSTRMDIAKLTILGGGPAGLGVAFYANRAGIPFALFEKASELGGMCRTLTLGAHRYDSGAHRFHDRDAEVTHDIVELMGDEFVRIDAPSAIWDRGRFVDFPPTPLNALMSSGIREAGKIGWELLRTRIDSHPGVSFQDFAIGQFGETLARRILLNYSEKLWGLPADQLSPEVATRRLQGMNLRSLFVELLFPGRKTEHIDGTFLYPRSGYGAIVERIAGTLPPESIFAGREAARLECDGGFIRRIHFADGSTHEPAGRIVSTLPLTLLAKLLDDQISPEAHRAAAHLRFRHMRLLFIRLARPSVSTNASIYIPDREYCVSRIYEPRNRSAAMAPTGETSLVAEVACFTEDAIATIGADALAARVIDELTTLGLFERNEVVEWRHHFLANAYPVYTLDYGNQVEIIRNALGAIVNLDTLGRAGMFVYSHLHDQLRFGKDYVESQLREETVEPLTA
jgi:protoporphyrinogen oxidase